MNTPIFDFINEYRKKNPVRAHMPGHKGMGILGFEDMDLTEITGADELYNPTGIILESENNASTLFGSNTMYSTEGSSHCIRGMLFLFKKWCAHTGAAPLILAGRNIHKTYINTAALLDIQTVWMMGHSEDSIEECRFSSAELESRILEMQTKPTAVYITSPDYLGNVADIKGYAEVCHNHGILLLVDNAHGAYLKYLTPSIHPIDLGADICADSAHKTLPVLTGGAYLHISERADSFFHENAKLALEMFGSTSPSYLVLASLDVANRYMSDLSHKLSIFLPKLNNLKESLRNEGYVITGNEALKICINFKICHNISGKEAAAYLEDNNIFPEYYDNNHLVLMLTPENSESDLNNIFGVLKDYIHSIVNDKNLGKTHSKTFSIEALADLDLIDTKMAVSHASQHKKKPQQVLSPAKAILSDYEIVPEKEAIGRVLACSIISCPPAIPAYMMGELIEEIHDPERLIRVVK